MASILSFLNQAVDSLISSGSGLNTGCKLVLSCAGESVTFPVSPPSFEISNAYNNSTINVNSLGDINMLGKRGLTTIKFSSFFPEIPAAAKPNPLTKMTRRRCRP